MNINKKQWSVSVAQFYPSITVQTAQSCMFEKHISPSNRHDFDVFRARLDIVSIDMPCKSSYHLKEHLLKTEKFGVECRQGML